VKKRGFISSRIFRIKNRRHHPSTEQAYRKSFLGNLKTILFSSWVNVLLIFVPVGIAVRAANVNATVVFSMNCVAVVPLAAVLPLQTFLILASEFCHGGNFNTNRTNIRSINECQFRQRRRTNCIRHRPRPRKNRHRPGLHPRKYSLQHPLGISPLLLD
jgi:hypothetical protein